MKGIRLLLLFWLTISAISNPAFATVSPNPATDFTKAANAQWLEILPFANEQDFKDAAKGLITPLPNNGIIKDTKGRVVWDMQAFQFVLKEKKAPDTVNPSLWRQMQLVMQGGLFKVCDRLYQVRNADLSNMTIIEGDTGIIVIDPLISAETAKAALDLYYTHRPKKPIVAVFYSHSHVDHFGGVRGIIDEKDVSDGKIKIIAPEGFTEAAVSENIYAGNAMSRRATYMYGNLLPPSPKGQVGAGLGTTTSTGTVTLILPTDLIKETGQKMTIDGLDFEFLMAPGSEAPAEMHWYVKQLKAISAAENCTHTLHNTYTLRGAKIRNPLAWSKYLDQTIQLWGKNAEVLYAMHHWPVWGNEAVIKNLKMARDGYRYINDQTLRLANMGYTPDQIAEQIRFPEKLAQHWAMRGYYGSVYHNVKATYVFYLGWFDGNPSKLHVLSPVKAAKKYVEYMGGAKEVLSKARKAYENGEYRWVAEVGNHVVFADPSNKEARMLVADALEQLGYQAESGPWRNFYLTGAQELRNGVKELPAPNTASLDFIQAMDTSMLLDYTGIRLNPEKAAGKNIIINLVLTDTSEKFVLELQNSALSNRTGAAENADLTIEMPRALLNKVFLKETTLADAVKTSEIKVTGDEKKLHALLGMLDNFPFWFNIVTPNIPLPKN
ncbi:alkyl/aryl-sulfatase [Halodesulfovibrio marinisediminis]|uniref:Linear primary-alkylsulfatase n=1 Tax=Halodesulfovibrio marinisediminis DSM 17456 TaxID=1121457 RepID=A0A1N6DN27_9BACT|nr:alkyl sulfatase dimerization domain-containing protein [Halodesulfovibrio marinisediminis]SIN72160.1 Alkyl sulfatase BDS1, metallo-beta-lactamase superfamily [Halodesulfovibrio marinisediminis DSM 17456]